MNEKMDELTENLIAATLDAFEDLHLLELDEDWMSETLFNDFSSFEDYPVPIEVLFPDGFVEPLQKVVEVCDQWAAKAEVDSKLKTVVSDDEVLWNVLRSNNIEMKTILCLLFLLCSKSVKPGALLYERQVGLLCAKIYLKLLQIPGSTAYSVRHPSVVNAAIACLKFPKEKQLSKKRSPNSAQRTEISGQRKRGQRKSPDAAGRSEENGDANDDADDAQEADLSADECIEMLSDFADLLKVFVEFLTTFSLKEEADQLDDIVMKLVEFTACENRCTDFDFRRSVEDIRKLEKRYGIAYVVSALAYKALTVVCSPLHGHPQDNYLSILKYLCADILCTKAKDQSSQVIAHRYVVIRDNAISFVCYNLRENMEYSMSSTKILVQQLCTRVSDKTDFRLKVAQSVVTILKYFPVQEYAQMVEWFERLVNHNKIQDRVVALEVLSLLMGEARREPSEELQGNLTEYLTLIPLVTAILERCSDKASSVRAKALSTLATNLQKILFVMKQDQSGDVCEPEVDVSSTSSLSFESDTEVSKVPNKLPSNGKRLQVQDADFTLEGLVMMIRTRTRDDKVNVRKVALQALEALICLEKACLAEGNLELLQDAAADPNVTVRKACICAVTNILQIYSCNVKVQMLWTRCILPRVLDTEKTVQAKCLEVMEAQFLSNINGPAAERDCAWSILDHLSTGDCYSLQRFLHKAFVVWKMEGKLRPNLRVILEREVKTQNSSAAWLFLAILTSNVELKQTAFVFDYWRRCSELNNLPSTTMSNVLLVISNCCKNIQSAQIAVVQNALETQIKKFDCPIELISASIETLFKLYKAQSSKEDMYQRLVTAFSTETMQSSEKFLSSVVLEKFSNYELYSEDLICRHLCTIGDLVLLCPSCVPRKMVLIIQTIIASPSIEEDQTGVASGHSGRSSSSTPRGKIAPSKIQAVAFVTLGKMCLQNEDLAKKCVPALACELASSENHVIRNNIVIVMADLCIRYTSVVDIYIPTVSACLKDASSLVRHQTLTLLAKLLQEDYIKWKDTLLYRMLSTVTDENKNICSLTEYIFGHLVVKKNPAIFLQHFVECICFLNSYSCLNSLTKFANLPQDKKLFALTGDKNRRKRMLIYKFMIKHTCVPKRLTLSMKLCQDILNNVAENVIPLDEESEPVVKDCLMVLSSEDIKLPSMHGNSAEESDDREVTEVMVVKAAQRTCLVQVVIPIVASLKQLLQELKSPLLKDLMKYLREICRDYKSELKDLFAADKALGSEIEFEIRRYEQDLEERRVEEQENNAEDLPCETPRNRNWFLEQRSAIMQSTEKGRNVAQRVGLRSAGRFADLPNVRGNHQTKNSSRLGSGNTVNEVRCNLNYDDVVDNNGNDLSLPSTYNGVHSCASLQPVVRLERLSLNDIEVLSKCPAKGDKKKRKSAPVEVAEDSASGTAAEEDPARGNYGVQPRAAGGVIKKGSVNQTKELCALKQPVVVLKRIECELGKNLLAASTPVSTASTNIKFPDVSEIQFPDSSRIQDTDSTTRSSDSTSEIRNKRKRRRKRGGRR